MRLLLLGLTILLSVSGQTPPAPKQNATASGPSLQNPVGGFVGTNACKVCHADVFLNFYKNPHFKSVAAGDLPPDKTGCEGCHGPGQKHIEAGGGAGTIPRAFSLMSPKQVMDTCLTCHAYDMTRANIRRSEHTLNDVACTSCHSIHHSPTPKFLLAKKQSELCYSCHTTQRAQFSMPSKHRVNEGVIQCTDCHNPHGSFEATWKMAQQPRMVDQQLNTEQPCIRCHTDKRGPFVYEHPSVRVEGCATCHNPHGAMNAKLLRRPVVFTLCLECHNGAPMFGTRPGTNTGVVLQSSKHNMLDPRYQKCTTCHVALHGSNNDQFFLR
jgi:DmsE family decaheme c-type cytochrome